MTHYTSGGLLLPCVVLSLVFHLAFNTGLDCALNFLLSYLEGPVRYIFILYFYVFSVNLVGSIPQ